MVKGILAANFYLNVVLFVISTIGCVYGTVLCIDRCYTFGLLVCT